MINCKKCDFLIKSSMRHSLVKNCCPACGAAILGETQTQRMRLFKQRLLTQEFAQSLSDDTIFDITLFMLLEFSPINNTQETATEEAEKELSEEANNSDASTDSSSNEDEYEKIRDEIREQVLSTAVDAPEEVDEDYKIARLKRLAKESRVKMSGTVVRRLGND